MRHTGTDYTAGTRVNRMKLQCADEDNETTTLLMEMQSRTSTDDYIDEIRTSAATDISHLADHSLGESPSLAHCARCVERRRLARSTKRALRSMR